MEGALHSAIGVLGPAAETLPLNGGPKGRKTGRTDGGRPMRTAVGSDEKSELTDALVAELEKRGHEVVAFGPVAGDHEEEESDWPLVCGRVAEAVAAGEADEGIVCCWTGTGASIAANKVPGIRAALVHDAQTARGARVWNHANVLALSLRATPIPVMREILEAWLGTPVSEGEAQSAWNRRQIDRIRRLEEKHRRGGGEQLRAHGSS